MTKKPVKVDGKLIELHPKTREAVNGIKTFMEKSLELAPGNVQERFAELLGSVTTSVSLIIKQRRHILGTLDRIL